MIIIPILIRLSSLLPLPLVSKKGLITIARNIIALITWIWAGLFHINESSSLAIIAGDLLLSVGSFVLILLHESMPTLFYILTIVQLAILVLESITT